MAASKKEVIEAESAEVAPVELTPMQLISQVVENPDFDVDKLDKMMQLQERWEDRQAARQFNDSLSRFQAECPKIIKDKKGAHDIKYAPLDTIMATIQPALSAHGLSVRFSTSWAAEGYLTAVCTVSHGSGHSEASEITIPVDDKMSANSSQRMGSANSYAKRYAMSNALNLAFVEHDNDAADLSKKINEDQATVINDLIAEIKLPEARKKAFLKWAKANTIEEIPAAMYDDAKRYLEDLRDETA